MVFAAITVTAGIVLLISSAWLRHVSLYSFFGITNAVLNMHAYVSRLRIRQEGCAQGFERVSVGYQGEAIIDTEYKAALCARKLLQTRLLAHWEGSLFEILSRFNVVFHRVDLPIDVSPENIGQVSPNNLLLVGSQVYNLVSGVYLQDSSFIFKRNPQNERAIYIKGGGEIEGRSANPPQELAIIQKLYYKTSGRTVFICAGVDVTGTFGSLMFLLDNWRVLKDIYGNEPFGVGLAFVDQQCNTRNIVTPKVVFPYDFDDRVRARGHRLVARPYSVDHMPREWQIS